jgi:serine phosphatase RsbU (regulator of sigma subunit)/ligand-binding sensor domain-containing protein
MKTINSTFQVILMIILLSTNLLAQKMQIEEVLDQNSLPIKNASNITQDKYGFLWISSWTNELLRYDGYEIRQFKHSYGDTTSIPLEFDGIYADTSGVLLAFDNTKHKIISIRNGKIDSHSKYYDLESYGNYRFERDKKNNLWIYGKNGLIKFNNTTNQKTVYYNGLSTYIPKVYKLLDSMERVKSSLCEIINIGINSDTTRNFNIENDIYVLVVCVGERRYYNINDMCNFGIITNSTDTLWQMKMPNTKHAGGAEKNRIEFALVKLKKGNYKLRYISNYNYDNKWNVSKPNLINFSGIKVFPFDNKNYEQFSKMLSKEYFPTNIFNLASDVIIDILTDNNSDTWFLSEQGILKYNYDKESFTNLTINLPKIDEEYNFLLFLGKLSNSVDIKDKEDITLYEFVKKENIFWIATNYGLIKYDLNRNISQNYFKGEPIYSIIKMNDTEIVCITPNTNFIFNTKSCSISDSTTSIQDYFNNFLFKDISGKIWSDAKTGIFKYKTNRIVSYYNQDIYEYRGWKPVFFDENKYGLWSYDWGLAPGEKERNISFIDCKKNICNRFRLKNEYFPKRFRHSDIFVDDKKNLWFSTANYLHCFDSEVKENDKELKLKFSIHANSEVLRHFEDSKKQLWFFTRDGVYQYSDKEKKLTKYITFNIIKPDNVDFILEDSSRFWIRTYESVSLLDTKTKVLKTIIKFEKIGAESWILSGDIIKDENNIIWFASETKLYKYVDNRLDTISICNLKDVFSDWMYRTCIVSQNDNLWISTSHGLYQFNKKMNLFKHFTEKEGLCNNNIFSMVNDKRDNLWLATMRGLSKFNTQKEYFTNFYAPNDVKNDLFNACKSDNNLLKNGEIIFYNFGNFIIFNPDSINKKIPIIALTKFALFDKEYELDSAIYEKHELKLNYTQNFFSFEFAALDFTNPKHHHYSYKLEGVDKDWVICDATHRLAKYTNVSPGEYVFTVKGSNSDDVWNEIGTSIRIIITPPWYKTTLAYSLYALLFIGLIYLIIKLRERKFQREKEHLEKIVMERTAQIQQQNEEITTQRDDIMEKNEILHQQNEEIKTQTEEISAQRDALSHQKNEIISSIQYAKKIQDAVLPNPEIFKENLPEHFVLFKPKDIVSGDFYWMKRIKNFVVLATADCTGHGVPGAFMSMLGISLLNEVTGKSRMDSSGEILNHLRKKIKTVLRQEGKDMEQKDGMDIALCIYDFENYTLQYSGAYNPLYVVRNNTLTEYKADRQPCAVHIIENDFTTHEIQIQKNDIIYSFSDGYSDQYGGENNRKYMSKNFREYLLKISHEPMEKQKELLDNNIETWKNDREQIDDITVIGVKIC